MRVLSLSDIATLLFRKKKKKKRKSRSEQYYIHPSPTLPVVGSVSSQKCKLKRNVAKYSRANFPVHVSVGGAYTYGQ